MPAAAAPADAPLRRTTLWVPKHVQVTRAAAEQPHTAEILRRCEAAGVTDIQLLPGDRLTGLRGGTERETYARGQGDARRRRRAAERAQAAAHPAERRLAASTWPGAARRTASTATSPARSPARRSPGSTPTSTRSSAGIGDPRRPRHGHQRHRRARPRGHHVRAVLLHRPARHRAPHRLARRGDRAGSARARTATTSRCASPPSSTTSTTCCDLAARPTHPGAVLGQRRARSPRRFEGGTARLPDRLAALRRLALAGYPVGLTIAPVMPVAELADGVRRAARRRGGGARRRPRPRPDRRDRSPTASPRRARTCCSGWYPRTKLEMDEDAAHAEAQQVRRRRSTSTPRRRWPRCAPGSPPRSPTCCPRRQLLYWT